MPDLGKLFASAALLAAAGAAAAHPPYGARLTDFLNYRPHATEPAVAASVLQWGRDQGVVPPEGGSDDDEAYRELVHARLAESLLPDAVLPREAPDAGVEAELGPLRVVMFGPEGNVEDNAGNTERLGFERFGHYMFPSICRLRDGQLLVRVFVGGDGGEDPRYPRPPEWLHYLSDDGGAHWRHVACYDRVTRMASQADERPITEAALELDNGEQIRFQMRQIEVDAERLRQIPVQEPGNWYRLGDLPAEEQWFPLFTRQADQREWTAARAEWDPDTLIRGEFVPSGDAERPRTVVRLAPLGYPWFGDGGPVARLADGELLLTIDARQGIRPLGELRPDGSLAGDALNYVLRSTDRGRSWRYAATIPDIRVGPWFVGWRAHLEPRFSSGAWTALYRTRGLYSGAGPMFVRLSHDQGRTWSPVRALRPCSSGVIPGTVLDNGIAVRAYGRPGAYLMFCSDGRGALWGSDVALIEPWPTQNDALSCNNPQIASTGPDRFVVVYSQFDVPDPWGTPRLAVVVRECTVRRRVP